MLRCVLLILLLAVVWAKDSYVVIAPSQLRPGMVFTVSVNILTSPADLTVTASILSNSVTVVTNSGVFKQGQPGTIELKVPAYLSASEAYTLAVSGSGGIVFSNTTSLTFSAKAMSVFIQTDKAIYKPGQTVNFRAFCIFPDLQLYTGTMDVEIYDANSNKIRQWLAVSSNDGVIVLSLDLSTQPVLGDWKIKIIAEKENKEKFFSVEEYVLPKFDVKVDLPPYILTTASEVPVAVSARYTYDQPVAGAVVVEVKDLTTSSSQSSPSIQHTAQLAKDGRVKIIFTLAELQGLSTYLNNHKLQFTANVTETLTGKILSGTSSVQIYQDRYKMTFLESNPNTFKPGLDYVAYLKVYQPDGLPVPAIAGQMVKITTTVTSEMDAKRIPSNSDSARRTFFPLPPRTTTYELTPLNLSLPDNGLVVLQLRVPSNATSITIRAEFDQITASTTVSRSYSPTDHFMQIFLKNSDRIQAGNVFSFEVKATENMNDLIYQILSRGSIVSTGRLQAGGTKSYTFSLPTTSAMAPNARMVVYYVRPDNGEIVTDSTSFEVDGTFQNQVSIELDRSEAQPAESVQVSVHATPKSRAYCLAVDLSVLHLKSGNDVTADQVAEEIKSYDTIKQSPSIFQPMPFGGDLFRRKRMSWFPYPRYYGGSDATQIFKNAGVVVLTDALLYQYIRPFYPKFLARPVPLNGAQFFRMAAKASPGAFDSVALQKPALVPDPMQQPLQEVQKIRSDFPEAWLWASTTVGDNGTGVITATVPDTITSFVASAFAVSNSTGLGVAPTTAKLRVFRPFFVSLNLPYSVKRGEQVALQAIVFNYLSQDQDVRVSLAESPDFYSLVIDADGREDLRREEQVSTLRVPAGEGKSVYFPMVPSILGSLNLIVSARTSQAADAVRRQLLVKPEGVPKEYAISVLIDLKNDTTSFSKTVPLSWPSNQVPDSQRVRITCIGDLMGPTISGIDGLLSLPTGCGEQTMLGLSSDVYITSYLKATNQLTGDIQEKALKYMESGYQRELTYQHKDGSFSAFGEQDSSGSMWLTAFVAKTFHQARPYIFMDDQLLIRAVSYMLDKQNADGSFPEPGRVIHTEMQGGLGGGVGLTAYVLVALLENSDLQGSINQRIATSKVKAVDYLKQQISNMSADVYLLSITAYALALAKDPAAASVFAQLDSQAVVEDGLKYWHKAGSLQSSTASYWRAPGQTKAIDVEMTAYALLSYVVSDNYIAGLNVLKWIASQRNPRGGYYSTQDTVLALQALSEFASLVYSNSFNVQVTVSAGSTFSQQFSLNQDNALVLQSVDLPTVPDSVTVSATGSGIALCQVSAFFSVEAEVEEPTFSITVRIVKDTLNSLEIEVCARWLVSGSSGMALEEVGIPSGFEADLDSIDSDAKIKKTETQDGKVILYFDEIGASSPECVRMMLLRTGLVAKSQPVAVRVYSYYEPSNQATAFYQSSILKGSGMCELCLGCKCPARRK